MSSIDREGKIRPWRFARRLTSMLALSASLVAGTAVPAEARGGGRGGGGAMRGGGGGAARSGGGAAARPSGGAAARPAAPAASRPSAPSGGAAARPNAPSGGAAARPATQGRTGNVNSGNRNVNNAGNRNANVQNRQANVNVNRNDVNINRNTAVRAGPTPYARAPYAYGGRRYYSHNVYVGRPYVAYGGWGPYYRPFGAVVATMAATAVAVSVANSRYYFNAGGWYAPTSGGYTVVTAPVGGVVTALPSGAVVVTGNTYYYGGTYYEKTGEGYKVAAPVAGTVVEHLPEGGEEVTIGDRKFVKFGETYYQPIQKDGKNMYEVVEVK